MTMTHDDRTFEEEAQQCQGEAMTREAPLAINGFIVTEAMVVRMSEIESLFFYDEWILRTRSGDEVTIAEEEADFIRRALVGVS
jgi:hypothetical protein